MATNLFAPTIPSSNFTLADGQLTSKSLNFSRYIPHGLYSKSSGTEDMARRRVSGLKLSHTVKLSQVPDMDDVSNLKNSSTSISSQIDLERRNASSERSWIKSLNAFLVTYFVEWWLLEIISLSFSAICMGTIVAVLSVYDGLAIPDWPFGMTINGFISVLSNFAKSALLLSIAEAMGQLKWNWFCKEPQSIMDFERIDTASRGPWGALTLLFRTKGTTLTSIGALIVILSLPLDIFFQQLVTYPQGFLLASDMTGSIPQAFEYNTVDGLFSVNGSARLNPSFDMVTQIEPFFHGTGSIPRINGDCSTNNCTWIPYDSLSVCSKCVDLSADLHWACTTAPADWLSTVDISTKIYPLVTACGYWFTRENRSILMSGYVKSTNGTRGEALSTRIFGLSDPDPSSRQPIFGGTIHLASIRNPIVDFLIAGTPNDMRGVYANTTPTLTECALHWCVNTFQSSNHSSSYSENITDSVQLEVSSQDWPWYAFTDETGLAHNRYQANFSLNLPSRGPQSTPENTFVVENVTMVTTILSLDEIVPAYVTAPNDMADSVSSLKWLNAGGYYGSQPPQLIPLAQEDNPWLPPNNVSKHMERLAAAMSVVVRNTQASGKELRQAKALVWKQHTLVKIRWAWISLPVIVLALSLFFMIGTVVISTREREQVGIWKTSVIAVLFNGLGDEVKQVVPPNCSMGEAREKAQALKVRLVPD